MKSQVNAAKNSIIPSAETGNATLKAECGFCYTSEHGKHGEVQREWSKEFEMYIPVCRKHRLDRCAFPGECLMVGDHLNSECHTVDMYEQLESAALVEAV